ncbi:hypothetical protein ACFQ6B_38480 [Streptomyces wedmorensis]|uniref:Uncharacterized protein n=1 Tax=Streptomyces wedmorensis TaxID=43759 RepID=A0ABW6IZA0_STRWE
MSTEPLDRAPRERPWAAMTGQGGDQRLRRADKTSPRARTEAEPREGEG